MNSKIILSEEGCVPRVGVTGHGRVLREGAGQAKLEIGQCVPGDASVECKHAIIVQQCLLNVLVQREVAPKLESVPAFDPTEGVSGFVEIRSRNRTRN